MTSTSDAFTEIDIKIIPVISLTTPICVDNCQICCMELVHGLKITGTNGHDSGMCGNVFCPLQLKNKSSGFILCQEHVHYNNTLKNLNNVSIRVSDRTIYFLIFLEYIVFLMLYMNFK